MYIEMIVQQAFSDVQDGASALHACARSGHVEVARFLCEAGADKDRAMMEGATPLLAAALQGHTKVG